MRAYHLLLRIETIVAAMALIGVICLTGWAAVTRFLAIPNIWVLEVTSVLFAWACFLSASIAFRSQQHFKIEYLEAVLPDHLKRLLPKLRAVLLFGILVALIWYALDYVEMANRRTLPFTGIRFSWVVAALPVACAMMALNCLVTLFSSLDAGPASNAGKEA